MTQRKIFTSLSGQKISYTPRDIDKKRSPSIIAIGEQKHAVESEEIKPT